METIDKVTKFGTIAHNLIEETETYFNYIELVSKRKPGMDVIKDIADSSLFNLDAFEHFLQEKRRLDIVSAPVVNMASLGMAGYYGLHNGAITLNAIANMMTDLYARKNRDYGNSFDKSMDKFGLVVAAIRIGDKVNRLQSLIAKGGAEVKDESMADTCIDLACYAIMTLMWCDDQIEK